MPRKFTAKDATGKVTINAIAHEGVVAMEFSVDDPTDLKPELLALLDKFETVTLDDLLYYLNVVLEMEKDAYIPVTKEIIKYLETGDDASDAAAELSNGSDKENHGTR